MSCIVGTILCYAAAFTISGPLPTTAPHVNGNWGYVVYAGPILSQRRDDPVVTFRRRG